MLGPRPACLTTRTPSGSWLLAGARSAARRCRRPTPTASSCGRCYSGVSRGTESLVFHGRVPVEEYQRMRAPFQDGDFPAPVKYGYASVGVVERGHPALVGRTVFALYPHQTRYVVPASAVHLVPDGVPARRAVLAANLETALNGVWDAAVGAGRPRRGRRRRRGRVPGGVAGRPHSRLRGGAGGREPGRVRPSPTRLGVRFADPAGATWDTDVVFHASGTPAGSGHGRAAGRRREHGGGAELVRRHDRCRPRSAARSMRAA